MILALLLACRGPAGPVIDTADVSAPRIAMIHELKFARDLEPGVSRGFDLDGRVSMDGDGEGCGHADRTSPDGTPGIDNALAGLLPTLEATLAAALEDLVQGAIQRGDLLLAFRVEGVDDPVDDDCVDVTVDRAFDQVPMLAPDGTLLDAQTFALEPYTSTMACAPLRAGVLETDGLDIDLQVQILDVFLELELFDGRLRLELGDRGEMSGMFAGKVPIEGILDIVAEDDLAEIRDLVTSLMTLAADMRTDDGSCGALSITFEFEAVEAFTF